MFDFIFNFHTVSTRVVSPVSCADGRENWLHAVHPKMKRVVGGGEREGNETPCLQVTSVINIVHPSYKRNQHRARN